MIFFSNSYMGSCFSPQDGQNLDETAISALHVLQTGVILNPHSGQNLDPAGA